MLLASLITAGVASASVLLLLYSMGRHHEFGISIFAFACTLPMCWVMYHHVRLPIDGWLVKIFTDREFIFWIRAAYAPVTEEPAKLWPLLLPFVRRSLNRQNLTQYAVALGGGFAVGEVFTVADLIQLKMPEVAHLPWYSLGGFISERLMTVAIHSGLTASALLVMQRGYGVLAALMVSMTLHFIANFPIVLSEIGWLGSSPSVSQMLLLIWVTFCFVSSVAALFWISDSERPQGSSIYGEATFPTCGSRYSRSLFKGLNFGLSLRYEPCPKCRKWHWTRRID